LAEFAIMLVLNSGGEGAGVVNCCRATYQNAVKWRVAWAEDDVRRAIVRFHFRAKPLSIRPNRKRSHLHGIETGSRKRGQLSDLHSDPSGARTDHVYGACRGVGEIDDAVTDERAPIVDANLDTFVVFEIDHANHGAEGKGAVRRSELLHVVDFAIGGGAAVIRMAVPTRNAGFRVRQNRQNRWRNRRADVPLLPTGG